MDRLDHKFYIDWAAEDLRKAIQHLQVSADESGNVLVKAIINNLQSQLDLLKANLQLY